MIKDEDLKQAVDYSEGQKTAAYMILGEIERIKLYDAPICPGSLSSKSKTYRPQALMTCVFWYLS